MVVGGSLGTSVDDATDGREAMRADYRAQQRRTTRDTTLVGGIVALVALPAWAVFDLVMVPEQAGAFLAARLLSELVIAMCCVALWWRRSGERWPEQLSLLTIASPEIAIAWMIPRSGTQLEAYLLGFSLAIYATAFLLAWRWQMTVVLVACTGTAIALFSIGVAPAARGGRQITTIAFYVLTASALAIAAQIYRDRKAWHQHVTQTALEAERRRNQVLVAGTRSAHPRRPADISREPPSVGGTIDRRVPPSAAIGPAPVSRGL